MSKIRYAVVGNGWRAMFFVRAAKNLPELFEVTGIPRSIVPERMLESPDVAGYLLPEIAEAWGERVQTQSNFQDTGHYSKNVQAHL